MSGATARVATLVLAAGQGRRFGGDKLLARLGSGGDTVIGRTLAQCPAQAGPRVCTLRAGDRALQAHLDQLQVPWLVVPGADRGMSESLRAGLHRCADADGWLVVLADMPFVKTETYESLLKYFLGSVHASGHIFVPVCEAPDGQRRRGNPVLFGRDWREALLALSGDRGGRSILQARPEAVVDVAVDDPGIWQDIDYPDQLPG